MNGGGGRRKKGKEKAERKLAIHRRDEDYNFVLICPIPLFKNENYEIRSSGFWFLDTFIMAKPLRFEVELLTPKIRMVGKLTFEPSGIRDLRTFYGRRRRW